MSEAPSPSLEVAPGMSEHIRSAPETKVNSSDKDRKEKQQKADIKSADTATVQKPIKNTGKGVRQSGKSSSPAGGKDTGKSGVQKSGGVGPQEKNKSRTSRDSNQTNKASKEKEAKYSQPNAGHRQNVRTSVKGICYNIITV